MHGRIVKYINAEGRDDFLFTVESMLDKILESLVARGATNITVSVLH